MKALENLFEDVLWTLFQVILYFLSFSTVIWLVKVITGTGKFTVASIFYA